MLSLVGGGGGGEGEMYHEYCTYIPYCMNVVCCCVLRAVYISCHAVLRRALVHPRRVLVLTIIPLVYCTQYCKIDISDHTLPIQDT